MLVEDILFQSMSGVMRTLVIGVLAYVLLVALLRVSGKRTLAKMNAFDLVVTVALGSTLATILLSEGVALAEGATAFLVLVGMQFLVAKGTVLSRAVGRAVKSTPRALLLDGRFDEEALREERVVRDEVLAAVRATGQGDLSQVAAVVLETDGSFSVIPNDTAGDRSALQASTGGAVPVLTALRSPSAPRLPASGAPRSPPAPRARLRPSPAPRSCPRSP